MPMNQLIPPPVPGTVPPLDQLVHAGTRSGSLAQPFTWPARWQVPLPLVAATCLLWLQCCACSWRDLHGPFHQPASPLVAYTCLCTALEYSSTRMRTGVLMRRP